MFVGRFDIAVGSDGLLSLPEVLAGMIGGQQLLVERVRFGDGTAILALPSLLVSGQRDPAPAQSCRVTRSGEIRLPPGLLAEAGIAAAAVIEGMGEYLIIRPGP